MEEDLGEPCEVGDMAEARLGDTISDVVPEKGADRPYRFRPASFPKLWPRVSMASRRALGRPLRRLRRIVSIAKWKARRSL